MGCDPAWFRGPGYPLPHMRRHPRALAGLFLLTLAAHAPLAQAPPLPPPVRAAADRITTERVKADLDFLNPGDIVKIELGAGSVERIVVVRRAWEEIASPEI